MLEKLWMTKMSSPAASAVGAVAFVGEAVVDLMNYELAVTHADGFCQRFGLGHRRRGPVGFAGDAEQCLPGFVAPESVNVCCRRLKVAVSVDRNLSRDAAKGTDEVPVAQVLST